MLVHGTSDSDTSVIQPESSVNDVCQYLSNLTLKGFDFGKDVQKFENEVIDGSCFLQLDKTEIMNLGINKLSKRNALFEHIAKLNAKLSGSDHDHSAAQTQTNQLKPSKIESTKAIKFETIPPTETVSIAVSVEPEMVGENGLTSYLTVAKRDAISHVQKNKTTNKRKRSKDNKDYSSHAKTQEFSGFDVAAPEFVPRMPVPVARASIRRRSTATTVTSPRNAARAAAPAPAPTPTQQLQHKRDDTISTDSVIVYFTAPVEAELEIESESKSELKSESDNLGKDEVVNELELQAQSQEIAIDLSKKSRNATADSSETGVKESETQEETASVFKVAESTYLTETDDDELLDILDANLSSMGYDEVTLTVQNDPNPHPEFVIHNANSTMDHSIDAYDMEPSEVISLPPSVVMTDIVKPPQMGIASQTNSVQIEEMMLSPFTSMDFEATTDMGEDILQTPTNEKPSLEDGNIPRQSDGTPLSPMGYAADQAKRQNEETTDAAANVAQVSVAPKPKPQSTNAPYVMRLNVKKSCEFNDMAIVTFPAVFKDITETNQSETKTMLCLQSKTLKQLNVHYSKLNGTYGKYAKHGAAGSSSAPHKATAKWQTKRSVVNTTGAAAVAVAASFQSNVDANVEGLFDETQCEHLFTIKNNQLSVVFNQVKAEFPMFFRNYYSVAKQEKTALSTHDAKIIPSNTLVMVTFNFKNLLIMDMAPIPVRGTIETFADSSGFTWIESDLFVNGNIQHFGSVDADANTSHLSQTWIYSVQRLNLEDQRRFSALMDKDGQIIKKRSVIVVNDESFDHQVFQNHCESSSSSMSSMSASTSSSHASASISSSSAAAVVPSSVSLVGARDGSKKHKVEFFLKLTAPCEQLNSEYVLVEAWNILKVDPSMRQQKRKERQLSFNQAKQ